MGTPADASTSTATVSTTDLAERLRKQGRWVTTKRVPLIPQMDEEEWRTDPLSAEAADEIESLRTLLARAGDALKEATFGRCDAECRKNALDVLDAVESATRRSAGA